MRRGPDPASSRSATRPTPWFDVTVRIRARDAERARERIERWAGEVASYDSVEQVLVMPPVWVDDEAPNLIGES